MISRGSFQPVWFCDSKQAVVLQIWGKMVQVEEIIWLSKNWWSLGLCSAGEEKKASHWKREQRPLVCVNEWGQHHASCPPCLHDGLQEHKVQFITAWPRKSKQTSVARTSSSGAALPTLPGSPRPQDVWSSRLILSLHKNQTLYLVTNPHQSGWSEDGTMSTSDLSLLFTAGYLAFLHTIFFRKKWNCLLTTMISCIVRSLLKQKLFHKYVMKPCRWNNSYLRNNQPSNLCTCQAWHCSKYGHR